MTDWQRDLDDARATIEELNREIERMKPVVDAAVLWSDSNDNETECALIDAVIEYESFVGTP